MAFSSSTVTKGRATGVVVSTAMGTEIGAIATLLRRSASDSSESQPDHSITRVLRQCLFSAGKFLGVNVGTPLHRQLSQFAVMLFILAVVCAFVVFAANSFSTQKEVVLYAVATGLSMVPACLVVVLTITLAGGTRAMARQHVIVRKLDALEALGGVTDICSDKTGTLTRGVMTVRAAWLPLVGRLTVADTSAPFDPTLGDLSFTRQLALDAPSAPSTPPPSEESIVTTATELLATVPTLEGFLNVAGLCNLATVSQRQPSTGAESGKEEKRVAEWNARGDPTECAIQVFAMRLARGREEVTSTGSWTSVCEFPFDSDVKRMSVIYARDGYARLFSLVMLFSHIVCEDTD